LNKPDKKESGPCPHREGTKWRQVLDLSLRPLYPRGMSPKLIHWTGGWVGARAGLAGLEKGKISC